MVQISSSVFLYESLILSFKNLILVVLAIQNPSFVLTNGLTLKLTGKNFFRTSHQKNVFILPPDLFMKQFQVARKVKIGRILKKLKDKKEMDQRLYNKLRPCGSKSPMIYGLPKIHKKEVPLRLIVSCIQSPSYYISKYIASIISPLAGKTTEYIK